MFDVFDDDFAEDQSFLFDSLARNASHSSAKPPLCKLVTSKPANEVSAVLDGRKAQITITDKETPSTSKLKKFNFVKKNVCNLNQGIASPRTVIKEITETKASVSEARDSTIADVSVLQGIDFDSFYEDGFDFDDVPTAAGLLCERISVPLAVTNSNGIETSNGRINIVSAGTSRPVDLKCLMVPRSDVSDEFKRVNNNNSKNNIENTNIFAKNDAATTSNQIVRSKRKFPGPAGLLSKFVCQPELNQLLGSEVSSLNAAKQKNATETITEFDLPLNMEISCSQICEDPFQKAPWQEMIKDLCSSDNAQNQEILHKFNISSVLKQVNNLKTSHSLKFPLLCVIMHSMIRDDQPDVSALFKDKTGSISGMICQKLMLEFTRQLVPGSVLVLKQIMVIKLSSKRYCLNITPTCVVSIYSETNGGPVEHLAMNPISWNVMLREAQESPPSPLLSNSIVSRSRIHLPSPSVTRDTQSFKLISDVSRTNAMEKPVLQCANNNVLMSGASVPPTATSTRIAKVYTNTHANSVMKPNSLQNTFHGLVDSSTQSSPKLHQELSSTTIPSFKSASKETLQKSNHKLSAGGDLTDDPLWTDDDFESMLLDIDMGNAM